MSDIAPYFGYLLQGLLVTLQLSAVALTATIVLSTFVAICGISPNWLLIHGARIYADVFRGIPLLVLLVFVFFVVGQYTAKFNLDTFWLAALALTLTASGYQSEIYRAGLEAVPTAQWDAAASLGLSWASTVRLVILPQAIPSGIPNTVNLAVMLVKGSSLASLIAVTELTQQAGVVVSLTFMPIPVYFVLALLYLAVVLPLVALATILERAIERSDVSAPIKAIGMESGDVSF